MKESSSTLHARKRAMLASLAILLVAGISLSTATYAWFTSSQEVAVSELTMTAESASGIQISSNAATWKSTISLEDLQTGYSGAINRLPTDNSVAPVSSAGGVSSGQMALFSGLLNADNTLTAVELSDESAESYYAFDLFINNQTGTQASLYLKGNSAVTDGDADKDTGTAARVAFVNLGNAATTSEALALNGSGVSEASYIWEPNSTSAPDGGNHEKLTYEGISAAGTLDTVNSIATSGVTEVDTMDFESGSASAATNTVTDLPTGINKIRVYIWLEGQDVDCLNIISGGAVKALLNFTVDSSAIAVTG